MEIRVGLTTALLCLVPACQPSPNATARPDVIAPTDARAERDATRPVDARKSGPPDCCEEDLPTGEGTDAGRLDAGVPEDAPANDADVPNDRPDRVEIWPTWDATVPPPDVEHVIGYDRFTGNVGGAALLENGRVFWVGRRVRSDPDDDRIVPRFIGGDYRILRLLRQDGRMGVDESGLVWGWGYIPFGAFWTEYSDVPVLLGTVGQIADLMGDVAVCLLTPRGQILCGPYDQSREVYWPGDCVAFAVDDTTVCAIRSDGALECALANYRSASGRATTLPGITGLTLSRTPTVVPGVPPIAQLDLGRHHGCAVSRNGEVWCWGHGHYGQLGTEEGTVTCRWDPRLYPQPGEDYVWALGPCTTQPIRVPGLPPVSKVVVSEYYETCALGRDGSVWCWGANQYGGLGDETTDCRAITTFYDGNWPRTDAISCARRPQRMRIPVPAVDVDVRLGGCAVGRDGSLWCWGGNPGDGSNQARYPVPVRWW